MESPYLEGSFAPIAEEQDSELDVIEGEVPRDLRGSYVRNGPNPRFTAEGRHHWFDGDGMLHAVRFDAGRVSYANRWIRTADFEAESDAGRALYRGVLERTRDNPGACHKDTGNTDVLAYRGQLLTFHYMGGAGWRVDPHTLATEGAFETPRRLSAHAKVDPETGELLYFDYGVEPPYLSFGSVSADGGHRVAHAPVDEPVYPHDMAFTKRFGILMEPPVTLSAKHAAAGRWGVEEHPDRAFRFHLLPRAGGEPERFEASHCYIYHVVDAWDDVTPDHDEVVVVGFRCPKLFPTPDPAEGALGVMMANLRLRATLHRWRFDRRTGQTREEPLDDRNAEFPTIDVRAMGQGARFGYAMTIPTETRRVRFGGVAKYDTRSGACLAAREFGPGHYGSEVAFAPRSATSPEDDGYLISFVRDEVNARSEVVVWDAANLDLVCRLGVRSRVPHGFHACWSPEQAS